MARSLEHVGTRMAPCFYVSHTGWPQHADVIHGAFPYPQFWIVYLNETALIKRWDFQPEPCLYWRRVTFKWHMKLVLECLKCLRCGHYKRKSREYCEVLSAAMNWELCSAWACSPGSANHNWTMDSQYGTILMSCCGFNFCFVVLCIVLHNGVSENNTMAYFSEFLQRNWKRRDVYKVRGSHSGSTLCIIITVRCTEGRHCHIGWHLLCVPH